MASAVTAAAADVTALTALDGDVPATGTAMLAYHSTRLNVCRRAITSKVTRSRLAGLN